mgnify:CR=1 FL=1
MVAGAQVASIKGMEAVYELPLAPRGLVFLAHGCQHSALDFWPYSTSCAKCIGLPEEVRVTNAILTQDWGAIALSAADRGLYRCWNFESDAGSVVKVLAAFRQVHRLSHLPLAALGVSSGGAFVLQLARRIPLSAIVCQVMAIPPSYYVGFQGARFPPTLFIHMFRDQRTAMLVRRSILRLNQTGVRTGEIVAPPLKITPGYFCRVPRMNMALAAQLHRILAPILDANGCLQGDPRETEWRQLLVGSDVAAHLPGTRPDRIDTLEPDVSPLAEILNVAWAEHEITSEYMRDTMRWISYAGNAFSNGGAYGGNDIDSVEDIVTMQSTRCTAVAKEAQVC